MSNDPAPFDRYIPCQFYRTTSDEVVCFMVRFDDAVHYLPIPDGSLSAPTSLKKATVAEWEAMVVENATVKVTAAELEEQLDFEDRCAMSVLGRRSTPLDPAFHPGAGVTEPTLEASLRGGGGITPAAHPTPADEARARDISGFLAFVAEARCARLTHRRDGELTEHGIDHLITRYLAERPRSS